MLLKMTQASSLSGDFFEALAADVAQDDAFARLVAAAIVDTLTGTPARSTPLRPAGASAAVAPHRGLALDSVERVFAAIRAGASTKKDILALAGVSKPAYSYALKALRARGLVRVLGTRGTGIIAT